MESVRTCVLCKKSIEENIHGITILPCSHSYHITCFHGFLTRNAMQCVACPDASNKEGFWADFGDCAARTLANERRQKLMDIPPENPTILTIKAAPSGTPIVTESMWKRIFMDEEEIISMQNRQSINHGFIESTKLPTLVEMVEKRVPSLQICKLYGPHDFQSEGITIKLLLHHMYDLDDMRILGLGWHDMLRMGLNDELWKQHRNQFPIDRLLYYFPSLGYHHFYQDLCSNNLRAFCHLGLNADDLEKLRLLSWSVLEKLNIDKDPDVAKYIKAVFPRAHSNNGSIK